MALLKEMVTGGELRLQKPIPFLGSSCLSLPASYFWINYLLLQFHTTHHDGYLLYVPLIMVPSQERSSLRQSLSSISREGQKIQMYSREIKRVLNDCLYEALWILMVPLGFLTLPSLLEKALSTS